MTEKDGTEHTCRMSGIQIVVPTEIRKKYGLPKEDGETYLRVKFVGVVDVETKEKITQVFEKEKK